MPNGQRIYVGNLPPNVRERSVERFFKGFGRIREVVLKSGYGFVEFDDPRDADDAVNDLDGKDFQGGRVRVEMARDPRDKRRDNRYNGGGGGGGGGYHHNDRYHRGGGGGGGYRDHHRDHHRGGRDRYSRRDDYDDHRGGRGRNDHRGGRDGGGGGGNPPGPRTNYRIIVSNLSSRTSWQDLKDYFRAAGDITYTNAHTPRQGEGVVEFASRKGLDYALDHADDLELDGKRLKIMEEKSRGGGGGDRSRSRSRSRSPRSRSDSRGRSRGSRSPRGGRSRSRSSRSHSRGSPSRSRSNTPNRNGDDDDDDRR